MQNANDRRWKKKPGEGDQLQHDRNDKSRIAQEIYTKSHFDSFQMTIFLVEKRCIFNSFVEQAANVEIEAAKTPIFKLHMTH